MQKHYLLSQRALGFYALIIVQLLVIVPLIYNRLTFHGDIYLDISFAYDLKHNFETMGLGRFLKYFFFEATDHKAQPLSHLFFPFLFFVSDAWIIHDGLAIFLNLILTGSIYYILASYSKRVFLPVLFALCIVNSTTSTEKMISYELILVLSAMYFLSIARLRNLKDFNRIDPTFVIASSIAIMARPMDAAIAYSVLYIYFFKSHKLLKNKNVILTFIVSAIYWVPRLSVLWVHGAHIPRFGVMSLVFTIPVISIFFLGTINSLLLFKKKKDFVSEPLFLGLVTSISVIAAYYGLHIMINDYAIFPIALGCAALALVICNSPYTIFNKVAMTVLTALVLTYFLVGESTGLNMSLNRPTHWKRPAVFNAGPALANILRDKKIENVDLIYSERVIKDLPKETFAEMKVIQLVHLYLQNSLNSNGVYSHLSWPYLRHILWWFKDGPADPEPQAYDCDNLGSSEGSDFVIIDVHSEDQSKPNLGGKYFDKHREVSKISKLFENAKYISTDTLMEGVSWDTYAGKIECSKN